MKVSPSSQKDDFVPLCELVGVEERRKVRCAMTRDDEPTFLAGPHSRKVCAKRWSEDWAAGWVVSRAQRQLFLPHALDHNETSPIVQVDRWDSLEWSDPQGLNGL